jgi:hypothetical protein
VARTVGSPPVPSPRQILVLAGVGVIAYVGMRWWLDDAAVDPTDQMVVGVDGRLLDEREQRDEERRRRLAGARGLAPSSDEEAVIEAELAELDDPTFDAEGLSGTEITPASAEAGFDYAMRRVARAGKRKKRLRPETWDRLYRQANDAFTALSMTLDARDPDELARLEAAHAKLREGLARVRVRGDKFGY